jgi:N-terminal domain of (some) glycogen debranching enzymes
MTTTLVRPDILYGWKGPSLFVTNTRGECGDDQTLSGYYFREARFVRTLRLEIDGDQPWLCEAATVEPHILSFHYTYPEVAEYGGGGSGQAGDDTPANARGIPQRALAIRLLYIVTLNGLTVRLTVTNHSKSRVTCATGSPPSN